MAQLVPETERSRAVAYAFGGLDLGSVIGLLLCGPLINTYGWPNVFYVFAALGLAWAVLWPLVRPEEVDAVMQKEAAIMQRVVAERKRTAHIHVGTISDAVRPSCLRSSTSFSSLFLLFFVSHCDHLTAIISSHCAAGVWPPPLKAPLPCRCPTASFCRRARSGQ